jgi:hypothetical protein
VGAVKRCAAALLLWGCYAPSPPSGAPCDPAVPTCPDGQACLPAAGGGFTCGGQPGPGPNTDAGPGDAGTDGPPGLAHVRTAAGWSARVFHDFSAKFTYVPIDFVDSPEMYDNQPDHMFVLRPPFAEALAIVAGRVVIELTATTYTPHDYGGHMPNTAGLPDHLRGGTYVPSLDGGGPALLLTSSSAMTGDGTFRVTPTWAISSDRTTNNTRAILWDPTGAFDAAGTPNGYLGTMGGVVPRAAGSMGTPIIPADTKTMHLAGANLLLTRQLQTAPDKVALLEVTGAPYVEKLIAERTAIELADGPAPAPHPAWAIVDRSQLVLVRADGSLELVAELTDSAFGWQAAAVAAPPHALAGTSAPIVYILEGNRGQEIDRVLALQAPPQ